MAGQSARVEAAETDEPAPRRQRRSSTAIVLLAVALLMAVFFAVQTARTARNEIATAMTARERALALAKLGRKEEARFENAAKRTLREIGD